MSSKIEPHKIIQVVSGGWKKSFSQVESNKKVIAEQGWLPYNQNLLTYPDLGATMTQKEKDKEKLVTSDVTSVWHYMHEVMYQATSPTYEAKYFQQQFSPQQVEVNMVGGTAAWYLKTIVRQDDLMTAREHIKEDRGQGKTYEE